MIPQKHKVIVEIPHRISGFFEIVDEINGRKINNPEKIGSRGAGFNLNSFGRTEIIFEEIEDLKITGDKGTYLADDSITLVGNVKYYHAEYKGETEKLIYDSVKDKLYFPRENTLLSTAEKLNGTTQKGEYDLNTEVFYGEGFIGDDDKIHLESNYIHYDDKTAIAKLTGDVIVLEGAMKAGLEAYPP